MATYSGRIANPLEAGLRNQKTIASFKDIVTLGDVTRTSTEQTPRKSLLSTNMGVGIRKTWFTDLNFFKSITQMATPVTKVLKGSTTVGIQYEPVNTAPVTAKPIRRWPREWHGENM